MLSASSCPGRSPSHVTHDHHPTSDNAAMTTRPKLSSVALTVVAGYLCVCAAITWLHPASPGGVIVVESEAPPVAGIAGQVIDVDDGTYSLLYVIDGDTIKIEYEGKPERVRLLRIDTPEEGKPGREESMAALKALVGSGPVRLEFEKPGEEERGPRLRQLLAYVFVGDLNVNVEMVRLGWSRFWTKYGRGRLAEEFGAAEREAREAKRGMWRVWSAPEPPDVEMGE